jgi:6-phosphogluconolactonase
MTPRVFPSPVELAFAAAESFKTLALEAVAARGRCTVALSGGSTPKAVYEHLATLEGVPWHAVHLFWGDERLVAPDDARSNYRMAHTALLEPARVPVENVHRIRGELEPDAAVAEYMRQLEAVFGTDIVFDLAHFGVGPDGHTASLFPATPDLETAGPVLATFPTPGLDPQVARVSLGLPVLNAARVKQFFVTGAGKRPILERIRAGEALPAARVTNAEWWLDAEAAAH